MAYSGHPTPSSAGYQPLPSEEPPAYAPVPSSGAATNYPPGYSTGAYDPYKGIPQPSGPSYPGSYQGGAAAGVYPTGPASYPQQPVVHVVQPPTPSVIFVGGCPACQVGVLEDDFPCLGICCAIVFFPIGLLCCLAMKEKRCTNCGAVFG